MAASHVAKAPRVTRTLYLEVGLVNGIDFAAEKWKTSKNEAASRILTIGLETIIKDSVARRSAAAVDLAPPTEPRAG